MLISSWLCFEQSSFVKQVTETRQREYVRRPTPSFVPVVLMVRIVNNSLGTRSRCVGPD